MHEIELNVQDKTEKISGTLCLPEEKGSFPLVLMIPGSGDIDRDGNSKYQKLNIYNAIAHSLANNGIASFRYDKRGTGRSDGDFYSTGHFQLVDDARKCLKYLLGNVNIESMFVLGHSEGTIIAPRLVQDSDKVFGIILLCPFIDSFESIMLKQAISIKASARELSGFKRMYINLFFSIIDPVKAQKKLIEKINVTSKETVYSIFQKIPAKWFRELMSVEPKEIYRSVSCPSLIIGGSKDIQCSPDQ
ncbi:MAG TPA: alpha/beta fold hydrolase, partial [Gammaproteobacteria bacterium]|nr:alpha/beta fold hydrolase [Gammaproteobacteria bacterium]